MGSSTTVNAGQRPYFFWDYEITDEEVRALLRGGTPFEKAWIISRILGHAGWDDIWRYLTVADIRANFENLRFRRAQDQELWTYALEKWTNHV